MIDCICSANSNIIWQTTHPDFGASPRMNCLLGSILGGPGGGGCCTAGSELCTAAGLHQNALPGWGASLPSSSPGCELLEDHRASRGRKASPEQSDHEAAMH